MYVYITNSSVQLVARWFISRLFSNKYLLPLQKKVTHRNWQRPNAIPHKPSKWPNIINCHLVLIAFLLFFFYSPHIGKHTILAITLFKCLWFGEAHTIFGRIRYTIASITIYLLDTQHIYIYITYILHGYVHTSGPSAQKTHFHLSFKKVTGYSRSLFQKNCSVQCSRGIRLKLHRLQIYFFFWCGWFGCPSWRPK